MLNTLSNFELNNILSQFYKVIFSLVKNLFKSIEVLRRSVIIAVGSNTELIFDQVVWGKST